MRDSLGTFTRSMKTLSLFRHAKSSHKDLDIDDHERALNTRGQGDCITMARYCEEHGYEFDVIYSSTAVRAIDYAQILSDFTNVALIPDLSFYTFSDSELFQILKSLPDNTSNVAVVGHNPAIAIVTKVLSGKKLKKFPTSAMATVICDIGSWQDLDINCGKLVLFESPKSIC